MRKKRLHKPQIAGRGIEPTCEAAPQIVQPQFRTDTTLALPCGPSLLQFAVWFLIHVTAEQIEDGLASVHGRRHDGQQRREALTDRSFRDHAALCPRDDVAILHIYRAHAERGPGAQASFTGTEDCEAKRHIRRADERLQFGLRWLDLTGLRGRGDGNRAAEVGCAGVGERRKDAPESVVSETATCRREVAPSRLDSDDVTDVEVGEPDGSTPLRERPRRKPPRVSVSPCARFACDRGEFVGNDSPDGGRLLTCFASWRRAPSSVGNALR